MSRVIIDTSTIVNFEKLSPIITAFTNPNAIIKKNVLNVMLIDVIENVIEALLFYDEILLDERSIEQSFGYRNCTRLFDKPYCKFISINDSEEEQIYTNIISSFDISPANVSSIAKSIPTDWASFEDMHGNISTYSFIRNESYIGSYYSTCLSSLINDIQSKQVAEHIKSIPRQAIYEIVRYLFYIHIQRRENAHLIIHPCRDTLPNILGGHNYSLDWLTNKMGEVDKIWQDRCRELCQNMIPLPFIASYVLRRTTSIEQFFDIIDEIRSSKEAVDFRKALQVLVTLNKNFEISRLENIKAEFKRALSNWENNLNIVPGFRSKVISICIPPVSFEVNIPYIRGDKTALRLLTFIHKTMLNEVTYQKFKHLYNDAWKSCHQRYY